MNEYEWHLLEDKNPVESITIGGAEVKPGHRVRLRPRKGGDVFDMALAGKAAMVEAIEQDYEGRLHVSVVVDDDPGRDIGLMRQLGHRFFFSPAEIEPIEQASHAVLNERVQLRPTVLIAGIGNIFLGDDAFGVEVLSRFANRELPEGVRATDFGIRGIDLTYALLDGADVTILVDACPRGGSPGDLYVVEVDPATIECSDSSASAFDAHTMNPMNVIRAAKAMGGQLKRILLLGCEPQTLDIEEGCMGLSEPVTEAIDRAIPLLDSIVQRVLEGELPVAWKAMAPPAAAS